MDAAKKIILFVALVMVCAVTASASIPRAPENRVGEIFAPSAKPHRFESLQLHQSQWDAQAFSLQIALDLTIDADGRFGKGVSEGFGGTTSAGSPNSLAYGVGQMLGGVTSGYYSGLGEGVSNVSGYTSYQSHLEMFDGDVGMAANAAWNPAYMAMRGTLEAGGGTGLQPQNLGQTLTTGQRVWSGVEGGLGAVGTVGVGFGFARTATISGITAPAENFAANTYLNAVGRSEYASSFVEGTARLNIEFGGRNLYRAANSEGAAMFGEFASVQRPSTPLAAIQGNALNPALTPNRATNLFQVETRFGLSLEGVAAPQGVGYPGGFTQVFQVGRDGQPTWRSISSTPYLGLD